MPPDPTGPETAEEPTKARDGAGNGGSIADQAREQEVPIPEPAPLGSEKQPPLPGIGGSRRKVPVELLVVMGKGETKGAGQLDVEGEHLLVVRTEYEKSTTKPSRDGDRRVVGYKYVQHLRPTWVESFAEFLSANGLKLVRLDEDGDAVDPGDLVQIEELRTPREEPIPS